MCSSDLSGKPGKTQLINHFIINNKWYLVDLPGYGYAKISWTERLKWQQMIRDYILKRTSLMSVFLLVDIRLEPQESDLQFIDWLGGNRIPFSIVFTKSDKLSKQQIVRSVESYKRTLKESWEEIPTLFISSAEKRAGREDILDYIDSVNAIFKAHP